MSLFGVRYQDPSIGVLLSVGSEEQATALSMHAACDTWVVPVVVTHESGRREVQQTGPAKVAHPARAAAEAGPSREELPEPGAAARPAPSAVPKALPPSKRKRARQADARLVQQLVRAGNIGRLPSKRYRNMLVRRGWLTVDGRMTETGEKAVVRLRNGIDPDGPASPAPARVPAAVPA